MSSYENQLLDTITTAPLLEDRRQARRELERYYGRDMVSSSSERPVRYQESTHHEWYEDYRRDGTLKRRGGSTTTIRTFEVF
jgi:hypothetical protein